MHDILRSMEYTLQRCRYPPSESPQYDHEGASSRIILVFLDIKILGEA